MSEKTKAPAAKERIIVLHLECDKDGGNVVGTVGSTDGTTISHEFSSTTEALMTLSEAVREIIAVRALEELLKKVGKSGNA